MTEKNNYDKTTVEIVTILVEFLESNLKRQEKMKDPVIRHTVFLEKLCMGAELGLCGLKSNVNKFPLELQVRLDAVTKLVMDKIVELEDWIQQPIYSPDHPYGNNMMKCAEGSYYTTCEQINR